MKSSTKVLIKITPAIRLIGPAFLFLLLTTLVPFLYALRLSFYWWDLSSLSAPVFVGWENYAKIIFSRAFMESFRITMLFVVGVLFSQLLLGFGVALLLNRDVKGVQVFQSILIVPMVITPVVVGLCWKIMFEPTYGIINYLLRQVGIPPRGWITTEAEAFLSILLVDLWLWTPFTALVILAGLRSLSKDVLESSSIDGCSSLQQLWYIVIPLLKPIILIVTLLRVIDCIKNFDYIFTLTKGGPGRSTELLSIFIWRLAFRRFWMGYASAGAILILVLVIILSRLFIRQLKTI